MTICRPRICVCRVHAHWLAFRAWMHVLCALHHAHPSVTRCAPRSPPHSRGTGDGRAARIFIAGCVWARAACRARRATRRGQPRAERRERHVPRGADARTSAAHHERDPSVRAPEAGERACAGRRGRASAERQLRRRGQDVGLRRDGHAVPLVPRARGRGGVSREQRLVRAAGGMCARRFTAPRRGRSSSARTPHRRSSTTATGSPLRSVSRATCTSWT